MTPDIGTSGANFERSRREAASSSSLCSTAPHVRLSTDRNENDVLCVDVMRPVSRAVR